MSEATNKRDKILDKLRKLVSLKESAIELGNEGEANAAAAGISRLLMEYNLSEEDIPTEERICNPVVMENIPYRCTYYNGRWYDDLVKIVCDNNLCQMLIHSERSTTGNFHFRREKFSIVGRKKNVETVTYLISYLSYQFCTIGKRKYAQYKHDCIWKKGIYPHTETIYLKSFLYGCVGGLNNQYRIMRTELTADPKNNSLIVAYKKEIDEYLGNMKIGSLKQGTPTIDREIWIIGYKEGTSINLNSGLESHKQCVRQLKHEL